MLIDVTQSSGGVGTRWIADSGILDLFLLLGPNPTDVMAQYARLTGPTAMPQVRFGVRELFLADNLTYSCCGGAWSVRAAA